MWPSGAQVERTTLCRWPSGAQVERGLNSVCGRPVHRLGEDCSPLSTCAPV